VTPLDLTARLPAGRTLVEASAGTGKTYAISVLVARAVAGELSGHDLAEGVAIDEVLVVTYTRAAAAELRDRVRDKLRCAADYLAGGSLPPGDAWLKVFDGGSARVRQRRAERLGVALARFDEATITTIHGFCQQALAQSGLRTGSPFPVQLVEDDREIVAEVVRDLLLDRLADEPLALSPDRDGRPLGPKSLEPDAPFARRPLSPQEVERYLVATVRGVLSNPGARCAPDPSVGGIAGAWAACVAAAVTEVEARQRARGQIGYDRLVSDLAAALTDPDHGRQLAAQLAARYRLVLVDEFQDTDRLQWQIFDRAFADHRLVTVGDPKQAIYRFRGADVHAYLAASRSGARATLRTNHRSDRQLLDALAVLFDSAQLGHPDIEFARVDPSPLTPHNALGDAAVHLRAVPDDPQIAHTRDGLEAGAVAAIVLTDVAARVRTLLDEGSLGAGRRSQRIRPSDIGILVPSQRRAAEAASVLADWGIPSVRARTGSVLLSEAALHWRLLLGGLARPSDARGARAAGLSWFFDLAPGDLADRRDDADDSSLAELQRELATLGERLRHDGVGAFYERVRVRPALLAAVFARQTGDRDLTDLDHVAELLVDATRGAVPEPARVAEALDRLVAEADDQADATMRRMETDADAVRITTVHAAKGLEYPIVLVPFAYTERPPAARPYVFNVDGERLVDVASWVAWGGDAEEGSKPAREAMKERKRLATAEVDGDSLRLLYVALTRAKHHLEIWWAPTKGAGRSALGRLLLDRWGAGPVFNSPPGAAFERVDPDVASDQIDAIVAASNGTIARHDVPREQPVRRPLPLQPPPARLLAVADAQDRHPLADPARRTWSFTAITSGLAATPVAGGYDEPVEPVDGAVLLSDLAAGASFGIAVHEVLEAVDFTSDTLTADLVAAVEAAGRRLGLALDAPSVAAALEAAIESPLGVLFDGCRLRDIACADRLAELTFDLTFDPARVPASAIGAVLGATLGPDDPFRPYAAELVTTLAVTELAGWLTGSIDAVFRLAGPEPRFVIVDYKTNRVHEPGSSAPLAAYRAERLVEAMTHSHYPLQAVLYSVALHRYLRWRLGAGYDPERHLGGVAYLFVRGMVGGAEPRGVFSWHPPSASVLAVDELFRGGRP
jgi:exodeoxyribonuclease V beta subunit